jgi:hypothetical protein
LDPIELVLFFSFELLGILSTLISMQSVTRELFMTVRGLDFFLPDILVKLLKLFEFQFSDW